MANIYVDSAATGGSQTGASWANAYLTLAAAAAADSAGDTIWVKSTHSESTASAVTWDWAGTIASPTRVICVSDSNEPPTTVATGAVVAVTGANNLTIASSSDYVLFYGIRFKAGDSTNAADVMANSFASLVVLDTCAIELAGNSASSDFVSGGVTELRNCVFKCANTSSNISLGASGHILIIDGLSFESGSSAPNPLFTPPSGCLIVLENSDLSANWSSSANIVTSTAGRIQVYMRNSKLPASWTGSLNNTTPGEGAIYLMTNCDSTDTNYRLWEKTAFGDVTDETSIYVTAGASDGTTNLSWKMVSNTNAEWMRLTLDSPGITVWNETTGSSVTATVEFLIDSATTLNNNDVWMEVTYLGTSGYPLGSVDTDSRCATYLTTPTECTTGAGVGSWTGESGSAKSYKLTSTFTPQEKGVISVVVKLAKASTTIYVDPKITLS